MGGKDMARKDGRVPAAPGCEASPSAADGVFAESHPSRDICPTCGTRLKRPKAEPATAFGRRRAELGLSLQQVGNLAGITKAQVWEIERKNGSANPRLSTINGLATALQWSPLELLTALMGRGK